MDERELREFWHGILRALQPSIKRAEFLTWFGNTNVHAFQDGTLILAVPTMFYQSWINSKYMPLIKAEAKRLNSDVQDVKIIVDSTLIRQKKDDSPLNTMNAPASKPVVNNNETSQPLPRSFVQEVSGTGSSINPRYTLDSFVVGQENQLAFAAAKAVSNAPGEAYNPLFIYGGVGLGKTHLLQSIGNAVLKKHPRKRVHYSTSEEFTNEYIAMVQKKRASSFKEKYRNLDLLIVDDVQFWAGKEQTQVEFFHTFNALYEAGKQIVLSSDRPPREITNLEQRLKSRFEMGMLIDIQPPMYETKLAILITKCQEKGHLLSQEILEYIANNAGANVRELVGVLTGLLAYIDLQGKMPNLEDVAHIFDRSMKPERPSGSPTIKSSGPIGRSLNDEDILNITAEEFNLAPADLLSDVRKREILVPRQLAMYFMREELQLSLEHIGEIFGGKNHTTVMHACQKIADQIKKDKVLIKHYNAIKRALR
ncbi:MAG: chromosomal replication initiator protein DnaA [Candidatus Abawacabacteria bacterium]|nr:chromosomal replication initiator protein DnaA [Candidatus Abawacabacteria bacterium]